MKTLSKTSLTFIETNRLILRKPRIEDAESLYYTNSAILIDHLELPVDHDLTTLCKVILRSIIDWNNGTRFHFVLEEKSTGEIIGFIRTSENNEGLEIVLAEDKRGLNYISEAINGICFRKNSGEDNHSPSTYFRSHPKGSNRLTTRMEKTMRYRLINRRSSAA